MEQQQSLALPTVEAVGVRMLEAVAEVDVVARSPQSRKQWQQIDDATRASQSADMEGKAAGRADDDRHLVE